MDQRVLQPKRHLASALKLVYLGAFLFACADLWPAIESIKSIIDPDYSKLEDGPWLRDLYASLITLLGWLVILHHVRLYLTIELLEDPMSHMHRNVIGGLSHPGRSVEQLIRIFIVLFIGFKALEASGIAHIEFFLMAPAKIWFGAGSLVGVEFPPEISIFKPTEADQSGVAYFIYLSNVYLLLILWDICIWFFSAKETVEDTDINSSNQKWFKQLKKRLRNHQGIILFASHLFALLMCSIYVSSFFEFDNSGEKVNFGKLMLPLAIFGLMSTIYAFFFVLDLLSQGREYGLVIRNTFYNLANPFYGDSCRGANNCWMASNNDNAAYDHCPGKDKCYKLTPRTRSN